MKQYKLSLALLTVFVSANAQTLLMTDRMSEGGFEPVPVELTVDNSVNMAVFNYHHNRSESELMVAQSQEDIKFSVNIANSQKPNNFWQKSVNGGDWTYDADMSYITDDGYDHTLLSFYYRDVDNSYYPSSRVFASQNIFNNDDKWEYIVADVELLDKPEKDSEYTSDNVTYRHVVRTKKIKGFKIMSQNGTQLAYCEMPDKNDQITNEIEGYYIAKMNGMLYMCTLELIGHTSDSRQEVHSGMYLINPSTNSVQTIGRVLNRMSVNSSAQGITVNISQAQANESVSLTGMDGKLIDSAPASDSVTFSAPDNDSNIFNITLQGNGEPENVKVLIK